MSLPGLHGVLSYTIPFVLNAGKLNIRVSFVSYKKKMVNLKIIMNLLLSLMMYEITFKIAKYIQSRNE